MANDGTHDLPDLPAENNLLWERMRSLTAARIGLRRTGASLATGPLLEFQLAHARARDAVHMPLDEARLTDDLSGLGTVITVASAAEDRQHYLMRPDLGRTLPPGADAILTPHHGSYDLAFVVTDGLSAGAAQTHARPVLASLVPALREKKWKLAPLVIVRHGRVAIGDAIATALGASCVAVLIGERPGLTAPGSMGAYLTWQPHPGTTDADRNCISNIHPDGLRYADAAFRLLHLLNAMRTRRISGVQVKDDSDQLLIGEN